MPFFSEAIGCSVAALHKKGSFHVCLSHKFFKFSDFQIKYFSVHPRRITLVFSKWIIELQFYHDQHYFSKITFYTVTSRIKQTIEYHITPNHIVSIHNHIILSKVCPEFRVTRFIFGCSSKRDLYRRYGFLPSGNLPETFRFSKSLSAYLYNLFFTFEFLTFFSLFTFYLFLHRLDF